MPINGYEADDLVVCAFRLPSPVQPWVGGVHIGRVLEPGDDPADWNGHHSERDYCQLTNRVPVAYYQDDPCGSCQQAGGFQQHDPADALTKITAEQAALPVADKIGLFLGEDALARYRRSLWIVATRPPRGAAVSVASWPAAKVHTVGQRPAHAASRRRCPDPPSMPTVDAVEAYGA